MEAVMYQSKESEKTTNAAKLHLELKANKYKTLNSDTYSFIKASPHFLGIKDSKTRLAGDHDRHRVRPSPFEREKSAPEGIGKVRGAKCDPSKRIPDTKCNTMLHSRVASSLRPREADPVSTSMLIERVTDHNNIQNEEKPAIMNESFTCGLKRREARSYSQISKVCASKSKLKEHVKHIVGENGSKPVPNNNKAPARHTEKLMYPESHSKPTASEKENNKQVEKIAVMLNLAESAKTKGFVVTTNGSYINNLNINPVAYTTKTIEASTKDPLIKPSEIPHSKKRDSECVEIASKLELELKKTVRESERASSGGQNKFTIYRTFFNEIIKADPYFGGLLREIQKGYEAKIADLSTLLAKQGDSFEAKQSELRKEIERERKNREEIEKQRLLVLKELKRQALYIETLKGTVKDLKAKKESSDRGMNSNTGSDRAKEMGYRTMQHKYQHVSKPLFKKEVKATHTTTTHEEKGKHTVVIPKLDLSKIHPRVEDADTHPHQVEMPEEITKYESNKDKQSAIYEDTLGGILDADNDVPMDYHDEFMAMADEFSQSWKDALAKERRY